MKLLRCLVVLSFTVNCSGFLSDEELSAVRQSICRSLPEIANLTITATGEQISLIESEDSFAMSVQLQPKGYETPHIQILNVTTSLHMNGTSDESSFTNKFMFDDAELGMCSNATCQYDGLFDGETRMLSLVRVRRSPQFRNRGFGFGGRRPPPPPPRPNTPSHLNAAPVPPKPPTNSNAAPVPPKPPTNSNAAPVPPKPPTNSNAAPVPPKPPTNSNAAPVPPRVSTNQQTNSNAAPVPPKPRNNQQSNQNVMPALSQQQNISTTAQTFTPTARPQNNSALAPGNQTNAQNLPNKPSDVSTSVENDLSIPSGGNQISTTNTYPTDTSTTVNNANSSTTSTSRPVKQAQDENGSPPIAETNSTRARRDEENITTNDLPNTDGFTEVTPAGPRAKSTTPSYPDPSSKKPSISVDPVGWKPEKPKPSLPKWKMPNLSNLIKEFFAKIVGALILIGVGIMSWFLKCFGLFSVLPQMLRCCFCAPGRRQSRGGDIPLSNL